MVALYQWLSETLAQVPAFVLFVGAALIVIVLWLAYVGRKNELERITQKCKEIVTEHKNELTIRRKQLTLKLPYGVVDETKWVAECEQFIESVISKQLGELPPQASAVLPIFIAEATCDYATSKIEFNPGMSPLNYETLIADSLNSLGWNSRVTKASGDQGVDVIAERAGKKLVVQCKLYSQKIGNAAVQEINAGKLFERADFAAVVSNAEFTRSARQLAESTGVFLLHHDQLGELTSLCGLK